jgi:hypothetical protein
VDRRGYRAGDTFCFCLRARDYSPPLDSRKVRPGRSISTRRATLTAFTLCENAIPRVRCARIA